MLRIYSWFTSFPFQCLNCIRSVFFHEEFSNPVSFSSNLIKISKQNPKRKINIYLSKCLFQMLGIFTPHIARHVSKIFAFQSSIGKLVNIILTNNSWLGYTLICSIKRSWNNLYKPAYKSWIYPRSNPLAEVETGIYFRWGAFHYHWI